MPSPGSLSPDWLVALDRHPLTAAADESLREVAKKMATAQAVGVTESVALPPAERAAIATRGDCVAIVAADGQFCGLLSARELTQAIAADLPLATTPVADAMVAPAVVLPETELAVTAERLQQELTAGASHIPVVRDRNQLVGLLSAPALLAHVDSTASSSSIAKPLPSLETILQNLVAGIANNTGDAFFQSLVQYLAQTLTVDHAFVAELIDNEVERARTVAVWADGQLQENIEYDLAGTPCAQLLHQHFCCHPEKVQQKFPEDSFLEEIGAESYLGIPLVSSTGTVLGLISVMARASLSNVEWMERVLCIFAARASAELERLQAETALRQSEQQYRHLIETVNEGIWLIDADAITQLVNPKLTELLGYAPEEMLGRHLFDFMDEAGRAIAAEKLSHRRQGLAEQHDFKFQHRDGSDLWATVSTTPQFDAAGTYTGSLAAIADITLHKQALEALQTSERCYAALAEASPVGIFWADTSGACTYVNERCCQLAGFATPSQALGDGWANHLYPDDRDRFVSHWLASVQQEIGITDEFRFQHANGEICWVFAQSVPEKNGYGEVIGYVGTLTDITARKQAEENLRRYKRIVAGTTDGIALVDCQYRYQLVNQSYLHRVNQPSHNVIGHTVSEVVDPKLFESRIQPNLNRCLAGETVQYGVWHEFPTVGKQFLDATYTPYREADGTISGAIAVIRNLTEFKHVEEALQAKTEELDRFFSVALDLLCIANTDGYFVQVNPQWEKTLGYSLDELEGCYFLDLVHPDDRQPTLDAIAELAEQREIINFVNRYRCKDGTYRWIEWRSIPVGSTVYAAARDITERKQTEETQQRVNEILELRVQQRTQALLQQMHLLATILNSMADGIVVTNPSGDVMLSNPAAEEMMSFVSVGNKRRPVLSETFLPDGITPCPFDQLPLVKAMHGEVANRIEVSLKHSSLKHPMQVEATVCPLLDEEDTLKGGVVVFRDVTERYQAKTALARREHYLVSLVQLQQMLLAGKKNSNGYAEVLELLGKTAGASRAYLFKNERDEAGHSLMCQQAEWCAPDIPSTIHHQTCQNLRYRDLSSVWRKDLAQGREINCLVSALPERDRVIWEPLGILSLLVLPLQVEGRFWGYIGFDNCTEARIWDASEVNLLQAAASSISLHQERQQALDALLESEERFRQLAANISQVFWLTTPDFKKALYVSPAYEEIWQRSVESVYERAGQGWLEAIHPEDRDRVRQFAKAQSSKEFETEYRIVRPNGEIRWIRTRAFPIKNEAGQVYRIAGIADDITKRKQTEENVLKALEREKELNALQARFISIASHEFRTPLAIISSSNGLLNDYRHRLSDPQKHKHRQRIQAAVQHMTEILEDVLTISVVESDPTSFNPAPLDLTAFCREMVESLQASHPHRTLELSLRDSAPIEACLDGKLLRQILSNLMSNAIKYSPGDRPVSIRLGTEEETAVIAVRDEGIGIPETDRDRLFQLFQRGENVSNIPGTGLGLVIIKKCIDLHQGSIDIQSELGAGTTITVRLPLQPISPA